VDWRGVVDVKVMFEGMIGCWGGGEKVEIQAPLDSIERALNLGHGQKPLMLKSSIRGFIILD
jgi:hypothetical protein